MILTCPECASRYFVDDSKVGSAGRVVRCASCGHRWTARNEEAVDLFETPEASALGGQAEGGEPGAEAAAAGAAGAEAEEPPVSALPGEELPKVFRARANAERRLREATTTGVIWAGMAATMAVIVVAALIFRIDVVRVLPGAAGAYAAVGLPVNTVGLVIDRDSIKAQPSMQDGHAVVTVTGTIRNITEHEVTAPPLRVELLNKDEKRVAGQLAGAANAKIPPGEVRHFSITFLNPPRTAKDLQIGFATEPGAAKVVKTALKKPGEHGAQPDLSLRGAQDTPVEHEAAGQEPPGHESGDQTSPSGLSRTRATMNDKTHPEVLISEAEIAERVQKLAEAIAPRIDDDTVVVCLLTGGLWFAADLTRALYKAGRNVRFDALWLASYHDERKSTGRCEVRADLQRPLIGRRALVVDDVFDTGLSLSEAARLVKDAGASEVLTAVFARKPWPKDRGMEPDFVAWEAPARYLVGYGLDDEGKSRGLPYIGALD